MMIRMLILAVSLFGYYSRLSRQIRAEFAVGVLFSGIGSILFAAGILNIMQPTAWLLLAGGLYCVFEELRQKQKPDFYRYPGILFFGFLAVLFLILLYGSKFVYVDDFAHWGVAVKVIAMKDGFPNFADTNIFFQSYPLGSASFLYYFMEILGSYEEWIPMWAQAVLQAGMVISLFAFCRGGVQILLMIGGILMLLCSNIVFTALLVDTLLPLVGISAIAFVIYYADELESKLIYTVPYTVFLVTVKNSGMIFAAYVLVLCLLYLPQKREQLKKWAATAACPAVTFYLWKQHTAQVYVNSSATKHSVSLESYRYLFLEKSGSLGQIVDGFLGRVLSLSNPAWLLLGLCLLAGVIVYLRQGKKWKEAAQIILLPLGAYTVYQLGLLGTYLFSMPEHEAMILAAYDRYHRTILIYLGAITLLAVMRATAPGSGNGKLAVRACAAAGVLVILWSSLNPSFSFYRRQDLEIRTPDHERLRFDRLVYDYDIQGGSSYLIVMGDQYESVVNTNEYLFFLSYYTLSPEKLTIATLPEVQWDTARGYEYVILFDETEEGYALLNRYVKETAEPVIRQFPEA